MEILGLLDTLESIVLDSAKIPFTKRIMVDEERILSIIDKMRLVIQGGSDFAKTAIARGRGSRRLLPGKPRKWKSARRRNPKR